MTKRQEKIIELINKYNISTQTELTARLYEAGFRTTQSTISRDIRRLQLTKSVDKYGKSKYVVPDTVSYDEKSKIIKKKYTNVLKEGITLMNVAENLIVIRTLPGMAMAVAAAVDSLGIQDILGCIAGDDTIFCATSSDESAENAADIITQIMEKGRVTR